VSGVAARGVWGGPERAGQASGGVGAASGVREDIRDQALKRKITEFHAQFAPLA